MKKSALFLILSLIGPLSHAGLYLDVSVVDKKGIDIGLTLGSEIHSREEVRPKEDITLTMKSGLSVLLRASFDQTILSGEAAPATVVENNESKEKAELKTESKELNELQAEKAVPPTIIGPSSHIIIRGRVIGVDGKVLEDFFDNPLIVTLGDSKTITHSKDSQLVEIKIKPHIQ